MIIIEIFLITTFFNFEEFIYQSTIQLYLFLIPFTLSLAISIPLGYFSYKNTIAKKIILSIINTLKVIPPLAIIMFLIPFFSIGLKPSIIALTILGIPHIASNIYGGLYSIDKSTIEACEILGMTSVQTFYKVELPLALPVIITGCKTASIEIIACSTIAAFVGAKGFGEYIISGVGMMEPKLILLGVIPICILILFLEYIFDLLLKSFTKPLSKNI